MNDSRLGAAWMLLSLAAIEVFAPLLLISAALFCSIAYTLTLLIPATIDMWAALLLLCVLLPLMLLSLRAGRIWRQTRRQSARIGWRCLLPLLPLLVILPPVYAVLAKPSIYSIAHTDLQFAFINQVFLRESPYESVLLPGNPSNQYWLYFVFAAAFARLTALDTYTAWTLLNLCFVLATLVWIARCLLVMNLARRDTLRLGMATLFTWGAMNLTGSLSVLDHAANGLVDLGRFDLMLLEGADYRLHTILSTVVHGRAYSPGFAAFTAALFAMLSLLRGRAGLLSLALFSACGLVTAAVVPTIAFFIVAALLGGLAATTAYFATMGASASHDLARNLRLTMARTGPLALGLWFACSLALALPLIAYVLDFTSNIRAGIAFIFIYPTNIRMILASTALLLPPAAWQFAMALRKVDAPPCFLGFCALIGMALCLTFAAPANNVYKFNYLQAMLLAILSAHALRDQRANGVPRWAPGKLYVYVMIALSLLNAAYGSHLLVYQRIGSQEVDRFYGIRVDPVDDFGGRLPAFKWIRDHTPYDAVILVAHYYTAKSKLIHERMNYASKGGKFYSDYLPGYEQRMADMHNFYDPDLSIDEYRRLLASMSAQLPGRPLYAVARESLMSRDIMRQRGARLVFENPLHSAHVYLLVAPDAG